MAALLSVDEALARILAHIHPPRADLIPLIDAFDRILTQDIQSDINLPPFANSAMDGFAVHAADLAAASPTTPVQLPLVGDIPAGVAPPGPLPPGCAMRIMTGAPLPSDADAVIPVEATDGQWNHPTDPLPSHVRMFQRIEPGASVRAAGEDVRAGQLVLRAGSRLRPQDVGMLAALGWSMVPVAARPRAVIISTGDELIEVDQPLEAGKIRDVNGYTLAGLVHHYGGEAIRLPIVPDTLDAVRATFRAALDTNPDLIISSAGVSVGAFDVVRAVLEELGRIDFWRVNLRPGKPLAFGLVDGVPFFGLPGNPVSAMVTFDVFVRPALHRMQGRADDADLIPCIVGEDMTSDGRRSYLRVKLERRDGQLIAHTTGTQSSGALMSMVLADGLLIVPEGVTRVDAGQSLHVRVLRGV